MAAGGSAWYRFEVRRWLRRIAVIVGVLLLVAVAGGITLRILLHGERLARRVTADMNAKIRGRVEVASIDWDVTDLLTGMGTLPIRLRNVKIHDPRGHLVAEVAYAEATVHWAELLPWEKGGDLTVDRVWIPGGKDHVLVEVYEEGGTRVRARLPQTVTGHYVDFVAPDPG